MNIAILFSAAVLICLCVDGDAVHLGRRGFPGRRIQTAARRASPNQYPTFRNRAVGNQRPRIIVIQQDHSGSKTSRVQAAPAAPVAPAAPAAAFSPSQQGSHSMIDDLVLANALDVPFIVDPTNAHIGHSYDYPYTGVQGNAPLVLDPFSYELGHILDAPYASNTPNTRRDVNPFHPLIIADALDLNPHIVY